MTRLRPSPTALVRGRWMKERMLSLWSWSVAANVRMEGIRVLRANIIHRLRNERAESTSRSEERRVGKECRSRRVACHEKKERQTRGLGLVELCPLMRVGQSR